MGNLSYIIADWLRVYWRAFAVSRFPPGDDEGVEHEIPPRAKVEREVDRLGHVAVGAFDAHHVAAVLLKEEFHLDAVGGDDGVVIRLKWLASDRIHSVEAHRTGLARQEPLTPPWMS